MRFNLEFPEQLLDYLATAVAPIRLFDRRDPLVKPGLVRWEEGVTGDNAGPFLVRVVEVSQNQPVDNKQLPLLRAEVRQLRRTCEAQQIPALFKPSTVGSVDPESDPQVADGCTKPPFL